MISQKSATTCAKPCVEWTKQWAWIIREMRINSLIRLVLLQRPVKIHYGLVARTPRQQRCHFKKRRIHREWRIKRRWGHRKNITIWKREVESFKRKIFYDPITQLAMTMYAMEKLKKDGR